MIDLLPLKDLAILKVKIFNWIDLCHSPYSDNYRNDFLIW